MTNFGKWIKEQGFTIDDHVECYDRLIQDEGCEKCPLPDYMNSAALGG
ncbi:MAG: hypothetical protein ACOX3W_00525 [Christensenellaceae bacterium]|jgi:hypothetical protein